MVQQATLEPNWSELEFISDARSKQCVSRFQRKCDVFMCQLTRHDLLDCVDASIVHKVLNSVVVPLPRLKVGTRRSKSNLTLDKFKKNVVFK